MSKIVNYLAVIFIITAASIASFKGRSASISDAPILEISGASPIPTLNVEQKSIEAIVDTPKLAVVTKSNACDRIIINGKHICLFTTNDLGVDAGNKVALYGGNFYFGHNTSAVFATLPSVDSFQIVRGGKVTNYVVVRKNVFCDYSNRAYPCSNYPNDPVLNMAEVLKPSKTIGNPTAISLMTCAGMGIGGGDATHRFVAYAIAR